MARNPVVYIVSDSVGETAEFVVRAAASQFDGGHCDIRRVTRVGSRQVIDETVVRARQDGAMIAFTIVLPDLREYLLEVAGAAGVRTVDIMGPILDAFEAMVGQPPRRQPGLVHQLDDDYFRRVEAIEFAVKYDDGRDPRGLARADIVLIGVSRTSKTPLSMYLAHKQVKVANVPLVPEVPPPAELYQVPDRRRVIGLTIRPDKLNVIRQERLRALGLAPEAAYASHPRIQHELEFASAIMERLQCTVIDVSDKAVEETAGVVLEHLADIARQSQAPSPPGS
ncbi:MAG: kinase/pyrophosphorylase [Alicyclobacillus sp.]|nr:kinase/pyrophosphorylase [Alicyclobacillus sp.]